MNEPSEHKSRVAEADNKETDATHLPSRTRPRLSNPVHLLAFGFGSGLARRAPGTFGTLAAIPPYLLLAQLPLPAYAAALLLAFVAGIWICGRTARDLGVHDHPGIVWDEFVGYWLTLFALPPHALWIVAGFVLFRIFDVLKPWPVGAIDRRLKGGLGIMVDDVVAGIGAAVCLQVFYRLSTGAL